MRRMLIAGNWKMNLSKAEGTRLVEALVGGLGDASCEVAVCPPLVYLDSVRAALGDSPIALGAQNVYAQPSGAFTGEVSVGMLIDIGCTHVILGHSERRHLMGESNEAVNHKLIAALEGGLIPIVCVGETLDERAADKTFDIVAEQFYGSFAGVAVEQMAKCVIAYEPVWAIGTGQTATTQQAEEVHAALRGLVASRYNRETADAVRIQYGGSVKPGNAAELLSQPNIDGALVGGASLKPDDFLAIINAAPAESA